MSKYIGYGALNPLLNALEDLKNSARLRANDLQADDTTRLRASALADAYAYCQLRATWSVESDIHRQLLIELEDLRFSAQARAADETKDSDTRIRAEVAVEAYKYCQQLVREHRPSASVEWTPDPA